ncbi:MAG: hypothetical protein ACRDT4_22790 [Micromonosporaceae bacterium]
MGRWKIWAVAVVAIALVLGAAMFALAEETATGPAPLPRIAAPDGDARGQLFEAGSGKRFVPRGNNYVRLAPDGSPSGQKFHSTFEPGLYDAQRAETALAHMRQSGYNVVRVFLDPGDPTANAEGRPHGLGRGDADHSVGYAPYLDNLADFVRRAAAHQIYVLPAMDYFPFNAYYYTILRESAPSQPNIAGWNAFYMQRSWINAKAAYLRNVAVELRNRLGAPLMTTLLAYGTDNEATYEADQAPFSLTSGRVTGPDGVSYDMAVAGDRQQAADASMVVYAGALVTAVRQVEPDALVTTGMFTYRAVGKRPDGFSISCSRAPDAPPDRRCREGIDYRYPARPASLAKWSPLSFLDVHAYPNAPGYSVDEDLASSEWDWVTGVVILGEYGAMRSVYHHDLTRAAYAMRDLQVATCRKGLAGWLFWTWDTDEDEVQRLFYPVTENQGAINGVLAPIVRPDPCSP